MLINQTAFNLTGKNILITGASSGIGKAIAQQCADFGANVIAIGRDKDRLAILKSLLKDKSCKHTYISADITSNTQIENLITELKNRNIFLDGVVHCAGISKLAPVRMVTEAHFSEINDINFKAPFMLTGNLLKKSLIKNEASLLFITSIAATVAVPGVSIYSGSKAAVISASKCLALELVKKKIRVNTLSPAMVETPLVENAENLIADSFKELRENYPLGFGKPSDISNAAIFFLSDASKWITGTNLVMSGGSSMV